jgi:hypothetical protein
MPITTRTTAKKQRDGKPHPKKKLSVKGKAKEIASHKRTARDDDSDSEHDDESDDESDGSRVKKKRRRTEPEVEVVDEVVEPEVVEVVDDSFGGQEPVNEQDVSSSKFSHIIDLGDLPYIRMMD